MLIDFKNYRTDFLIGPDTRGTKLYFYDTDTDIVTLKENDLGLIV